MTENSEKQAIAGLVLAGGRSERMGTDKGSLSYGKSMRPQVLEAFELLRELCGQAWISVNSSQAGQSPYDTLPTITDTRPDQGPAAGLLSAYEFKPATAWLILAVDMPRVSRGLLNNLISSRNTNCIATMHCHADGTIEPLCAIWEAHAQDLVRNELDCGRGSLRLLAEEQKTAVSKLAEPERLHNVNTPGERSRMQRHLSRQESDSASAGNGSTSGT